MTLSGARSAPGAIRFDIDIGMGHGSLVMLKDDKEEVVAGLPLLGAGTASILSDGSPGRIANVPCRRLRCLYRHLP